MLSGIALFLYQLVQNLMFPVKPTLAFLDRRLKQRVSEFCLYEWTNLKEAEPEAPNTTQ